VNREGNLTRSRRGEPASARGRTGSEDRHCKGGEAHVNVKRGAFFLNGREAH